MSERRDEKWLDDRLQRAVNGSTPQFDAQAWKQKYVSEYETLLARNKQRVGWGKPRLTPRIFYKVAIAAAILVVVGILWTERFRVTRPTAGPQGLAQESPAQMVSMISLSAAFRSGGMEGLDKQCDRALEELGPRPSHVSMQELLKDINSKG